MFDGRAPRSGRADIEKRNAKRAKTLEETIKFEKWKIEEVRQKGRTRGPTRVGDDRRKREREKIKIVRDRNLENGHRKIARRGAGSCWPLYYKYSAPRAHLVYCFFNSGGCYSMIRRIRKRMLRKLQPSAS